MYELQTLELPVSGMDCTECTQHVQRAIAALPGIQSVDVLLSAEKAVIRLDPSRVDLAAIQKAVEGAGYAIPQLDTGHPQPSASNDLSVTKIRGMASGCHLEYLHFG
jgi:Cu+-exporting ATPase